MSDRTVRLVIALAALTAVTLLIVWTALWAAGSFTP